MSETISIDSNKEDKCFIKDYFKNPTLDFFKLCNLSISTHSLSSNTYVPILNVSNKEELQEKLEENIFFISDKNYDHYFENCILLYNSSILFKNWFSSLMLNLSDIESFKLSNQSEESSIFIKIKLEIKLKNNNSNDFIFLIPNFAIINKKEYKLNFNVTLLIQYINSLLFKHVSNYNKNKEYKNNL